ncbi:hypothetical protein ACFQRB_14780 [Halobaculum litoreum]|uniref:Tat (Twin-arginine translocation) pathway signal sequence n=1 Tax=Halobaculum litoreum TaxID=3031998 RepID=A0ABD5XQJ7_9EURY
MNRREALGAVAAATAAVAGCSSPTVTERPTGEVDVTFRTEADTEYTVRLSLTDGGGTVVEEFESPVPPAGRTDRASTPAGSRTVRTPSPSRRRPTPSNWSGTPATARRSRSA